MSETAELAAALAAVQAELPEVGKNRSADVKNKEGKYLYSYTYADLADVSAAIMPLLGRHGLAFASFPGHEDGRFGLKYYLLHSSGGSIDGFFGLSDEGGMQLIGGRITYARRYCLCAVTGITADEDVDAKDDGQSRTVRRQPPRGAPQPEHPVQRAAPRTQAASPAQAATRPHAAVSASPSDAGEALPPLPGQTKTASEFVGEKLAALGADNPARTAGRILGRQLERLNSMSDAEAASIMRSLRSCKTPADLDGLIADLEMASDPRVGTSA